MLIKNLPSLPLFLSQRRKNFSLITAAATLMILSLLIPFLGLPPTRFGFFAQVESIFLGFWFLGAVGCVGIGFMYRTHPWLVKRIALRPMVVLPFALGVMTVICGCFHPLMLRNLTGSAQMGEGILTFVSIGALGFWATLLSYTTSWHKPLFWVMIGICTVMSTLTIIGSPNSFVQSLQYWKWSPVFFTNYVGFFLLSLSGIYVCIRRHFHHPLRSDIIFVFYLASFIWMIDNKTLLYGFIFAIFCVVVVHFFSNRLLAMPMMALGLSLALTLLLMIYNDDWFKKIVPDIFLHFETLKSRTNIVRASYVDLLHVPWDLTTWKQLIFGHSWGSYPNAMIKNLFLVDDISLYKGTQWAPTWEFVSRDLIHSHNFWIELFYALGIVGIIFGVFFQWIIFGSIPKKHQSIHFFILLMLMVLQTMWFQFPSTLPFTTIMMAFVLSKKKLGYFHKLLSPWISKMIMSIGLIMVIFVPIHGGIIYTMGKKYGLSNHKSLSATIHDYIHSWQRDYEDCFGGQRHIHYARAMTFESILLMRSNQHYDPYLAKQCIDISKYLSQSKAKNHHILFLIVPNNFLGELALLPFAKNYFHNNEDFFHTWSVIANELSNAAPFRSDLLIPFLNYLMVNGKRQDLFHMIEKLKSFSYNMPIVCWFEGSLYVQDPLWFSKGLGLLKKSIESGINRYMPLSAKDLQIIEKYAKRLDHG